MDFNKYFNNFSSWWGSLSPPPQKMAQKPHQPNENRKVVCTPGASNQPDEREPTLVDDNRVHYGNFSTCLPSPGIRPPTSYPTRSIPASSSRVSIPVLANTAYGIGTALPKNPLAKRKPDVGIMEEKSLPPTGSSLDETLTELETLLPNQMINQPDTEKTTEEEYLLKTNTEPIQTPCVGNR